MDELSRDASGGDGCVGVLKEELPLLPGGQTDEGRAGHGEERGQGVVHDCDLHGSVDDQQLAVPGQVSFPDDDLVAGGGCGDGLRGDDQCRRRQLGGGVAGAVVEPDGGPITSGADQVTPKIGHRLRGALGGHQSSSSSEYRLPPGSTGPSWWRMTRASGWYTF